MLRKVQGSGDPSLLKNSVFQAVGPDLLVGWETTTRFEKNKHENRKYYSALYVEGLNTRSKKFLL